MCIASRCHECDEYSIVCIRSCPCKNVLPYCLARPFALVLQYNFTDC
jgi:hypothetical protein